MHRRAALRFAAVLGASLLAGAACVSPTLPLPPPDEPSTIHPSSEHAGFWVLSGDCTAGALVTAFNNRTRKGVVVEDTDLDGRYSVEIEAELCDFILLSQEVVTEDDGLEASGQTGFVIEERASGTVVNDVCP